MKKIKSILSTSLFVLKGYLIAVFCALVVAAAFSPLIVSITANNSVFCWGFVVTIPSASFGLFGLYVHLKSIY